ncbi:GIY-YIG nuclease family protein [bacterium]|nr:GIY-YIG nuclease family protein [bacterium]
MKGCYVLILTLDRAQMIPVGKWGPIYFAAGKYAYVGSALGGLEARVSRHQRSNKRLYWHIDYLLRAGQIERVIWAETSQRIECRLAHFFSRRFSSVLHFGASDCGCYSHLFFGRERDDLVRAGRTAFLACGLSPEILTFPLKKSLT